MGADSKIIVIETIVEMQGGAGASKKPPIGSGPGEQGFIFRPDIPQLVGIAQKSGLFGNTETGLNTGDLVNKEGIPTAGWGVCPYEVSFYCKRLMGGDERRGRRSSGTASPRSYFKIPRRKAAPPPCDPHVAR